MLTAISSAMLIAGPQLKLLCEPLSILSVELKVECSYTIVAPRQLLRARCEASGAGLAAPVTARSKGIRSKMKSGLLLHKL